MMCCRTIHKVSKGRVAVSQAYAHDERSILHHVLGSDDMHTMEERDDGPVRELTDNAMEDLDLLLLGGHPSHV
jgi:hypothetical protein